VTTKISVIFDILLYFSRLFNEANNYTSKIEYLITYSVLVGLLVLVDDGP